MIKPLAGKSLSQKPGSSGLVRFLNSVFFTLRRPRKVSGPLSEQELRLHLRAINHSLWLLIWLFIAALLLIVALAFFDFQLTTELLAKR